MPDNPVPSSPRDDQASGTTTGLDLYGDDKRVVAVRVDGETRDLSRPVPDGATIEPVLIDSPDGLAILRHSAAHVAAQAVQ
ncbi:threonine--tRNA ligase, partial [Mycobacterium tuberculosis]|nr:threonine--tRNA ligase [Mycobacterium tuberculosis]